MKSTVLLTGASGSMGHQAFLELLGRRDEYVVRLLLRGSSTNRKRFAKWEGWDDLEIVWGDLTQPADVRRAVSGVDAVLHTAALISPAADRAPEAALRINYGGTRNLLDAVAREPDGLERIRFVYVGSVAQYGDRLPPIEWIRTGDPLKPSIHDYYALTKCAAESAVIESGIKHWVSMRQTYIAIPDTMSLLDPILFHQPLDQRIELITSRDAGFGLVQCLHQPDDFWGRVYNMAGGPECRVKYASYMNQVFRLLGVGDYREVFDRSWFALQNFHCGYYADSGVLNSYLGHQRDTLDHHLAQLDEAVAGWMKLGARLCPNSLIRLYMRRMSDPLRWLDEGNHPYINAFFGSREAWEEIPEWHQEPVIDHAHRKPEVDRETEKPRQRSGEMSLEAIRGFAESRGGRCQAETLEGVSQKLEWVCSAGHHFEASPRLLIDGGYWCPECAPTIDDSNDWDHRNRADGDPFLARYV